MNYIVGDIFTDDDFYTDRANFCNENGYFIEEIEQENGTRQFKICAPNEKTFDELKDEKLGITNDCFSNFRHRAGRRQGHRTYCAYQLSR